MPIAVPVEIASQITEYVLNNSLTASEWRTMDSEAWNLSVQTWKPRRTLAVAFQNLRGTSRSFRAAVDPFLFRAFTIKELSSKSLQQLNYISASSPLLESVHTCEYAPKVTMWRPIVRQQPSDYYEELKTSDVYGFFFPPLDSELEAEHEKRVEVAKQYDDLARVVWPVYGSRVWHVARALRWLTSYSTRLVTPRLANSAFLKSFEPMIHLNTLVFKYPVCHCDASELFNTTKSEMSLGLGRYLATRPPTLKRIALHGATLSDVEALLSAIKATSSWSDTARLSKIECFELFLQHDKLPGRNEVKEGIQDLHIDSSGGRPIAEVLELMPRLVSLCIIFKQDDFSSRLVISQFAPPVLLSLQYLGLGFLALDAKALRLLTLGSSMCFESKLVELRLGHVLIMSGSGTWKELGHEWDARNSKLNSAPVRPGFYLHDYMYHSLGYLNLTGTKYERVLPLTKADAKSMKCWSMNFGSRFENGFSNFIRLG